jgi:predicted metal-dependent hydrolase
MQNNIKIIKKNIKKVKLKVNMDSNILITVPIDTTDIEIDYMINNNYEWILKKVAKNASKLKAIGLKDTNKFTYLGNEYDIIINKDNNIRDIKIDGKNCIINLKNIDNENELAFKVLSDWCYLTAKQYFTQLVDKYLPLVNKKVNKITIRKMKTRWGSCNPSKQYINLNIELLKKSEQLIEYVVLHEVTHLIHRNHDNNFYAFLTLHMPDWLSRHKKLNQNSL